MNASSDVARRPLGEVNGRTCSIAVTSEPWDLGLDGIVVSTGRGGLGQLGEALLERLQELDVPESLLADLTPGHPLLLQLREDRVFRRVVLASAREGHFYADGPASVEAAALAAAASIELVGTNALGRLGLPLLGAGALGLDPADIAGAIIPAARRALEGLPPPEEEDLRELVFIAIDEVTADIIQTAWNGDESGVQLRMLADAPIDDERFDVLGHRDYAAALAFVIDHPKTGTPLTIAINAPWGAGKTSVANLTEKRIRQNLLRFQPPIICWFNAWHHDDAPNIATALAATVARAASKERSLWRRALDPLPTALLTPQGRRRRHVITSGLSVAFGIIALLIAGTATTNTEGRITWSVLAAIVPVVLRSAAAVRGTAADVGSLLRAPNAAFASGSIDEIRADLGKLIHQATQRGRRRHQEHRRLVVFIDDLERCQPSRSIEVCETVSHLLSQEDVVVVLIGDIQTLATAAENKYKDLAPRYRTSLLPATENAPAGSFGEMYLEKIIQFRFDLPADAPQALSGLVAQLVGTTDVGQDAAPPAHTGFLLRLPWPPFRGWRERRRRDQLARDVRTAAASASSGGGPTALPAEHQELVENQRLLLELEGPHLDRSYGAIAAFVRPLPRDVKRILNRIRFTLYLGAQRKLLAPHGPVSAASIGKWALLAERWPDLASAISNDFNVLVRVEKQADSAEGFVSTLNDIVPGYARNAELQRLLQAQPKLSMHAGVLARFANDGT